jgi:hypothetical protein
MKPIVEFGGGLFLSVPMIQVRVTTRWFGSNRDAESVRREAKQSQLTFGKLIATFKPSRQVPEAVEP